MQCDAGHQRLVDILTGMFAVYSYHRNSFPPHYQGINEVQLPGELFQEAVSVEYLLQQPSRAPPAFVLCLDLAQSSDALEVRRMLCHCTSSAGGCAYEHA